LGGGGGGVGGGGPVGCGRGWEGDEARQDHPTGYGSGPRAGIDRGPRVGRGLLCFQVLCSASARAQLRASENDQSDSGRKAREDRGGKRLLACSAVRSHNHRSAGQATAVKIDGAKARSALDLGHVVYEAKIPLSHGYETGRCSNDLLGLVHDCVAPTRRSARKGPRWRGAARTHGSRGDAGIHAVRPRPRPHHHAGADLRGAPYIPSARWIKDVSIKLMLHGPSKTHNAARSSTQGFKNRSIFTIISDFYRYRHRLKSVFS